MRVELAETLENEPVLSVIADNAFFKPFANSCGLLAATNEP